MNLNIGCGEFYVKGWMNIDVYSGGSVKPDMVASILDLPFKNNSANRIYCGHVLEHIEFKDLHKAVKELVRVLRPTGRLMVVGPDMDRAISGNFPEKIRRDIRGGGKRWEGDSHAWVATEEKTLCVLDSYFKVKAIPVATVPPLWPLVSPVGWQFAILGIHKY